MSRLSQPEVLRVTRGQLAEAISAQFARGFRLALVAAHEDDPAEPEARFRIVHVLLGTAGERVEVVVEIPRDRRVAAHPRRHLLPGRTLRARDA